MPSLPIPTYIPPEFSAGSTVIFTQTFSLFDPADWTMTLWLSQGSAAPVPVVGTDNSDGSYLFIIANAVSAALNPGQTEFSFVATNATQTHVAQPASYVYVLPNFAVAQTPTNAQVMVTLLQTVMAEFAATTRKSVNFAGQSFERASIKDYQEQLVYWQAQVIKEQNELNRLRGGKDSGRIGTRFAPVFDTGPYGVVPWPGVNRYLGGNQ